MAVTIDFNDAIPYAATPTPGQTSYNPPLMNGVPTEREPVARTLPAREDAMTINGLFFFGFESGANKLGGDFENSWKVIGGRLMCWLEGSERLAGRQLLISTARGESRSANVS